MYIWPLIQVINDHPYSLIFLYSKWTLAFGGYPVAFWYDEYRFDYKLSQFYKYDIWYHFPQLITHLLQTVGCIIKYYPFLVILVLTLTKKSILTVQTHFKYRSLTFNWAAHISVLCYNYNFLNSHLIHKGLKPALISLCFAFKESVFLVYLIVSIYLVMRNKNPLTQGMNWWGKKLGR